eukprot:893942-Amphidinium_carterae.1
MGLETELDISLILLGNASYDDDDDDADDDDDDDSVLRRRPSDRVACFGCSNFQTSPVSQSSRPLGSTLCINIFVHIWKVPVLGGVVAYFRELPKTACKLAEHQSSPSNRTNRHQSPDLWPPLFEADKIEIVGL